MKLAMSRIEVHPRVNQKRPELSDDEVIAAFEGALKSVARSRTIPLSWVGIGLDNSGRLLEWIAVENEPSGWLIIHAASATKKTLKEVGLK